MKFSDNLKKILKDRSIKITMVSEDTGIPISTLSEWTGGREPKVSDSLIRLCRYLNVSLDSLVMGAEASPGASVLAESIISLNGHSYCLKIYNHKSNKPEDPQ